MYMSLKKNPGDACNRIMAGLLYCIMLFTQLHRGQLLAVITTCVLFYVSFLYSLTRRRVLGSNVLVCCGLWLFMILYLVRPAYLGNIETKIEIGWLGIGVIMLLTASLNSGYISVSPSVLYDSALLGAVMIVMSMITQSTIGGLLAPPYAGTRYVGGFDGPNEMAHFYVLALSLMLGEHLLRRPVRFVWAKASVFVVVIISAWSRSALGALLVMYVLCFGWVFFQRRGSRRLRVAVVFLLFSTLIAYVYMHAVQPQLDVIRHAASGRSSLLETTATIVKRKPICGYGLGSYWFQGNGRNTTPHSEYFLFAASGGILGVMFLVGFYIYWFNTALKKQMYPEAITLLVFYALEAFFNNLVRGRMSFFFWVLILLVSTSLDRGCTEDSICFFERGK